MNVPATGGCEQNHRPTPDDVLTFLTYACYEFGAPFEVRVNVKKQDEYQPVEKLKKGRSSLLGPRTTPEPTNDLEDQSPQIPPVKIVTEQLTDSQEVVLTTVMDSNGNLVEIIFNRCVSIPRMLIQIIGMCIPYQPHLHRLTVRWGPLTTQTLFEISKYLSHSYLTDICLDDSPVAGRNYEVLLNRPSYLSYLSLARCNLDDEDCAKLAALLVHTQPAASSLRVLLLPSNRIGDDGACALAVTLRTNRCLLCLDLAGNNITDAGAIGIFKSLMEFRLTSDEIIEKRSQRFQYLKMRADAFARCLRELMREKSTDEYRGGKRRIVSRGFPRLMVGGGAEVHTLRERADALAGELVGSFVHPFSTEQTILRGGQLYCVGNTVLCNLNMSYNNLSFKSLPALYEVLVQQSWLSERAQPGLLHVRVDGNQLPVDCDELFLIEDLLERAHLSKSNYGKRSGKIKSGRLASMSTQHKS